MAGIVVALLVLGVIVVIHELGHFMAAKFFKIKVDTFSVGFGPRIVGFRYGETDYRLSAFPLGGYVKMAVDGLADTSLSEPAEFTSKPKHQRFLVALAGPAMNVVLAVCLLAALNMYGVPTPEYVMTDPVVGNVDPGSPAAGAGIQPGDKILEFDGREQPNWRAIETRIATATGTDLSFVIERSGERIRKTVTPVRQGPNETGYVGIVPRILTTAIVEEIVEGSPAQAAGIHAGDRVLRVQGTEVKESGRSVHEIVQNIPDETVQIVVLRNGRELEMNVRLAGQQGQRKLGVYFQIPTILVRHSLAQAFNRSIATNSQFAVLIFDTLGRLFKGEAGLKNLEGPLGLIRVTGQAADHSLATLIGLMALISMNLGIMNLMPIPILDGGTMLLLLIEAIMGRDLSLVLKERILQTGLAVLLILFVVVLYNDILKWIAPAAS